MPISLSAFLIGVCFIWLGCRAGALRWHYIPLGALWMILGVVIFRIGGWDRFAALYGLVGTSPVVGAIADHRVLTTLLHRPAGDLR